MPNTREKLIELLKESLGAMGGVCNDNICKHCKYEKYGDDCGFAIRADILIANGVTIQDDHHWATEQAYKNGYADGQPKWIPVTERLPEDGGNVLVRTANGYIGTELYCKNKCRFECCGVWIPVTHWMPLPEAPKGENADRCVSCGEITPEGRQVCPNCERSVTDG